jgi:hypothetical protein
MYNGVGGQIQQGKVARCPQYRINTFTLLGRHLPASTQIMLQETGVSSPDALVEG